MTRDEYNKFVDELKNKGYKEYPSPRLSRDGYAWFKSFGKSEYEEDRCNYQICFDIYDFSEYAHRDTYFKENPISIEPLILVSRHTNERIDLHLSHLSVKDSDIDEFERLGNSFFEWVKNNIKIKKD